VNNDHVQSLLLQLAYEMRDDMRELRSKADETSELLADLRERVAVLEAMPPVTNVTSIGPAPSARRDVGLMAGASALVAGVVELVRMLA
jgi:hypothetical protein